MINIEKLDEVLNGFKQYGMLPSIRRYSYKYDMEEQLQIVQHIGKKLCPQFVIDNENRFVYENLIRWFNGDSAMQAQEATKEAKVVKGRLDKGIYLCGKTGTGKSLCLQVFSLYVTVMSRRIFYNDKEDRISLHPIRADEICNRYAQNGDITEYKRTPTICIQDFGSECLETLYMGNRLNVLQTIIEYRGDYADRLTFISSNLPLWIVKDRYGDRVESRLNEMCNFFVLKGTDRRKSQPQQQSIAL